jgi:predicted amidophosphoribosyltransferase
VRAAVAYRGTGRILLLRAKLGRRRELFAPMGSRLARVLDLSDLDLRLTAIIPVPSHPVTLALRGFNPAMELARNVSRRLGVPVRRRVLRRRLARPERVARSGAVDRRASLRDAFVSPGRSLVGERILLVDDVLTSGATAEGCLRALRRAGAERILFAAWARTLAGAPNGLFDRSRRRTL